MGEGGGENWSHKGTHPRIAVRAERRGAGGVPCCKTRYVKIKQKVGKRGGVEREEAFKPCLLLAWVKVELACVCEQGVFLVPNGGKERN